jgi:hypothetical protein
MQLKSDRKKPPDITYARQKKKQNIAVTIEYFDHKTDACIGFFFVSFLTQLCWSRVRQTFVSLIIDVISRSLNVDVRIVYEVFFFKMLYY